MPNRLLLHIFYLWTECGNPVGSVLPFHTEGLEFVLLLFLYISWLRRGNFNHGRLVFPLIPLLLFPFLIIPNSWLGSDTYQFSSHWFDVTTVWIHEVWIPWPAKTETHALLIQIWILAELNHWLAKLMLIATYPGTQDNIRIVWVSVISGHGASILVLTCAVSHISTHLEMTVDVTRM